MKRLVKFAFAVLGMVKLSAGDGCCTPDQWEGVQVGRTGYTKLGYRSDSFAKPGVQEFEFDADIDTAVDAEKAGRRPSRTGFFLTEHYIYYDYTNTQAAVYANVTADRLKRSYFILKKYSGNETGTLYVVDLTKDKCYKKSLTRPFRKACIPDDAKAFPDFYLGAADDTLEARSFYIAARGKTFAVYMTPTVTAAGCIPIGESVTGVIRKVAFMESIGFGNIKPGISDPSVFDVPEACQNEAAEFGEEFDWLQSDEYSIFRAI